MGFQGHADRYDHDFKYRSQCLEREVPRVLGEARESENVIYVFEADYFFSSGTPDDNHFFKGVIEKSINKDWLEVAEALHAKKFAVLSAWDVVLARMDKVPYGSG